MKHVTLTIQDLEMLGACAPQQERFKRFFPSGVAVSKAGMRKLLEAYDAIAEGKVYVDELIKDYHFRVTWKFLQLLREENEEYAMLLVKAYSTKIGSKEYYDTFLKLFKLSKHAIVTYLLEQREKQRIENSLWSSKGKEQQK
jgi:hypothetical protein